MAEPKILVCGSISMDLILTTPRFAAVGETVLGSGYTTAPGGKGANQAVQAARLGANVTMLGTVGRDSFGDTLIANLAAAKIDTAYVARCDAPTGVALIEVEQSDAGAANRITVIPGANHKIGASQLAAIEKTIAGFDLVMLQLEIPMEINVAIAAMAARAGVPVMLNSAPAAALPDKLLKNVTYLSPNETEAAFLTGILPEDEATTEAAVNTLLATGVKNVIVTLGSRGSVLGNADGLLFCPAVPDVHAIDPTAAGDSFLGAFATAVARGADHGTAMRFASAAAAITVSRLGAQPSLPFARELPAAFR